RQLERTAVQPARLADPLGADLVHADERVFQAVGRDQRLVNGAGHYGRNPALGCAGLRVARGIDALDLPAAGQSKRLHTSLLYRPQVVEHQVGQHRYLLACLDIPYVAEDRVAVDVIERRTVVVLGVELPLW